MWLHVDSVLYFEEPPPKDEPNRYRSLTKLYPDWHQGAACVGAKDVVFFGGSEDNDKPPFSNTDVKTARELCASCPVFFDCLEHALTRREEYGVWAGTTQKERKQLFRLIDLGVPIKKLVADIGGTYGRTRAS